MLSKYIAFIQKFTCFLCQIFLKVTNTEFLNVTTLAATKTPETLVLSPKYLCSS